MHVRRGTLVMLVALALLAVACTGTTPEAERVSGDATAAAVDAAAGTGTATATLGPSESATPEATATLADASAVEATESPGDVLTGAPVPRLTAQSAMFDAGRLDLSAGNFPPLDDPTIVTASEAPWLEEETLVLGAVQNGEARAYPLFMMMFHHVANDELGGEPYLVTF